MTIGKLVASVKNNRIIAIDPASHSLAWVIYDIKASKISIFACGKINYKDYKGASAKFSVIDKELKKIYKEYKPQIGIIEQSIYVQNFETSRIISYIIGYSWGVLNNLGCQITDVNPLVWKSGIGYKNLNKKEQEFIANNGEKGSLAIKLKKERKRRVQEIVKNYFLALPEHLEDDDIIDAAGIGLWYCKKILEDLNAK
jgi:Holliday junction resolvasome RuvABC endonuclease subunit